LERRVAREVAIEAAVMATWAVLGGTTAKRPTRRMPVRTPE